MSTSPTHHAANATNNRVDDEDNDMIFAFDDAPSRFASLASFETSTNPQRISFGDTDGGMRRPPNPVAGLLHSDNDDVDDEDDDDDLELRTFGRAALRSFSAPPPRLALPLTVGSSSERKRKCLDDAAVGLPYRVRPLAKRAKSFAIGRYARCSAVSRSDSISIPRPTTALRLGIAARGRSRSGSAGAHVPSGSGANDSVSSLSSSHSSSPAWNAPASSLEYFCRRSLDVSSPLRLRFRDLMVGSVGRATSYTGP